MCDFILPANSIFLYHPIPSAKADGNSYDDFDVNFDASSKPYSHQSYKKSKTGIVTDA
jgi:hypothetical protein